MPSHNQEAALTAVEWSGCGDWVGPVRAILKHEGFETCDKDPRQIEAWKPEQRLQIRKSKLEYVDGWTLKRVWVHRDRWILGVTPHQYFFENKHRSPSSESSAVLLKGLPYPDKAKAQALLDGTNRIVSLLLSKNDDFTELAPLAGHQLSDEMVRRTIGESQFRKEDKLNDAHKKLGYHFIPDRTGVTVIPLAGVDTGFANRFCVGLGKQLRARGQSAIEVKVNSWAQLETRLRKRSPQKKLGTAAVFLLPKRGQEEKTDLTPLKLCEQAGFPFRRAYGDDELSYSIPGQTSSIISACGGVPYVLDITLDRRVPWTLGIDLSHRGGRSVLCVSLINPEGTLRQAWRAPQRLDERADPELLKRFLSEATAQARQEDPGSKLLVFRDGKWPDGVSRRQYLEALDNAATVVEMRKGGNPLLWSPSVPGPAPTDFWAPWHEGNTLFLCPKAKPDYGKGYGTVYKISWKDDENLLDLSPTNIASLILATRYAPALGPQAPNLPSALYWADGIAGANDKELKFRGQPVQAD